MPCYSPLTAYRTKEGGITFSRNASLSSMPLKLPCGQCTGCRLERSRQWALRCMHESKMHLENCVLTLTYNDEHLPNDGGLIKRDMQLFMKKLRFQLAELDRPPIRFYGCGEYGEKSRRPHYHIIVFGFDPPDKKPYKNSDTGTPLYTSALMEKIWGKGFCVVGTVTFESCAYVARYIVDKMTGPKADDWYMTDDGVILQSEFTLMSRRPGIGRGYYDKFGAEVYAHDSVIIRGLEVRPPRYYDVLHDTVDPKRMKVIKRKRLAAAKLHAADNTPERRRVKETVAVLNLNRLKRNVS